MPRSLPLALPLLAGLLPLPAACARDPEVAGTLAFVAGADAADPERPYFHDFGRVAEDERLEHTYLLHNGAGRDVAILDVVPACGCTVPRLGYRTPAGERVEGSAVRPGGTSPSEPLLVLPPGCTAELSLRIDTAEVHPQNTERLYTTRLATDLSQAAYLTVETKLLVEAPFQVTPARLELGQVPVGAGGEESVRVSVLSGYDLHPSGAFEVEGPFQVRLERGESFGRPYWDVFASIEPPVAEGRTSGAVTLATLDGDGVSARPVRIGISAFGVPDVRTDPARLIVVCDAEGRVQRGGAELFSLLPGQRLRVVEARVDPGHAALLRASCAPLEPDGEGRSARWSVALEPLGPLAEEVLSGTLTIELAQARPPRVEVPYVVHRR